MINSIKGGLFVKPLLYKDLRLIFMPFVSDHVPVLAVFRVDSTFRDRN